GVEGGSAPSNDDGIRPDDAPSPGELPVARGDRTHFGVRDRQPAVGGHGRRIVLSPGGSGDQAQQRRSQGKLFHGIRLLHFQRDRPPAGTRGQDSPPLVV